MFAIAGYVQPRLLAIEHHVDCDVRCLCGELLELLDGNEIVIRDVKCGDDCDPNVPEIYSGA